jgi:hypothetical protein
MCLTERGMSQCQPAPTRAGITLTGVASGTLDISAAFVDPAAAAAPPTGRHPVPCEKPAAGFLVVTVHGGKQLARQDLILSSDPFVRVSSKAVGESSRTRRKFSTSRCNMYLDALV